MKPCLGFVQTVDLKDTEGFVQTVDLKDTDDLRLCSSWKMSLDISGMYIPHVKQQNFLIEEHRDAPMKETRYLVYTSPMP